MKISYFFIIIILLTLNFTACEECEDCYTIIGDSQMETEACERLDSCSSEDFEPISINECKSRNYDDTCLIALIEAKNCLQARYDFQKFCEKTIDSSNSYNEEICNKIRLTCGYDNITTQECLDETIPRLGTDGKYCIDEADNCDTVANCL